MTTTNSGHGTHTGLVRELNEDAYIVLPAEFGLWVVADGMGGHAAGEVASAIAVKTMVNRIKQGASLVEAIGNSHRAVVDAGRHGEGRPGMGCTIVALQVNDERYHVAWVGDSRAYLWNGRLQQLSRDHSVAQYLMDDCILTEEHALCPPEHSAITQALGLTSVKRVRVDVLGGKFHPGEQILLCSDGLSDQVSDAQITEVMACDLAEQAKVDRLIELALEGGGSDNVTVILVSNTDKGSTRADNDDRPITQPAIFSYYIENKSKTREILSWVIYAILAAVIFAIGWIII